MEAMQTPTFWQILSEMITHVIITAVVAMILGVVIYYKTKSFLWSNVGIISYFYLGSSFISHQALSQSLFILGFIMIIANIFSIVIEMYLEKFLLVGMQKPESLFLTKNRFNTRAIYRLRK